MKGEAPGTKSKVRPFGRLPMRKASEEGDEKGQGAFGTLASRTQGIHLAR